MSVADFPDWTNGIELVEDSMSDFPDWTQAVQVSGGSAGGYASLTGTGETDATGDLAQNGGLSVGQVNPNNDTTTEIFTNFTNIFSTNSFFVAETYPAMLIEDTSANSGNPNGVPSIEIRCDHNPVRIMGGLPSSAINAQVNVGGGDLQTIRLTTNSNVATGGLVTIDTSNGWMGVLHSNNWGTVSVQNSRTSTTEKLAFYGTAPIAKPAVSGSRGGNAALASLITALANLGLVIDNSTP